MILLISDDNLNSTLNLPFNLLLSVLSGIVYLELPYDQVYQ